MDPAQRFSTKAEKYARYRWDYAPEAIKVLFAVTGISSDSTVADVGAGTGILTKHFTGKVGTVFAVEPNVEMRQIGERNLAAPNLHWIDARAEATTFPDRSIDLILVGQALHWFEPKAARQEFQRILKPQGWLAILSNHPQDPALQAAFQAICTEENGWTVSDHAALPPRQPFGFYYAPNEFLQYNFLWESRENWEIFLGGTISAADAPDEDHPLYPRFEASLKEIFDRFSAGGWMNIHACTELKLGRMSRVR